MSMQCKNYLFINRNAVSAVVIITFTLFAQMLSAATVVPAGNMQSLLSGYSQDMIVEFIPKPGGYDDDVDDHLDTDDDDDYTDAEKLLARKLKYYRKVKVHLLHQLRNTGVIVQKDYLNLPMFLLQIDNYTTLEKILNNHAVLGVYENIAHTNNLIQSLPVISQPAAQSLGHIGTGTSVVIMDTGVNYTLPAFGSCTAPGIPANCRVVVSQDIAYSDNVLDDTGHGTNVSAIAAAVAPGTNIVALDVFNGAYALAGDIIAAIDWSMANRATYNIVAINLSLGDSSNNAGECAGSWASTPFAEARTAGIIPVVASGNDGFINGLSSPACTPGAVRVGAVYDSALGSKTWAVCTDKVTAADKVACFSNSAATLTLLAPGSVINAGGYNNSGTSQAAPHVSAAIAVLRAADAFPTLTLNQIILRLQNTGDLILDSKSGYVTPRLNLGRAVIP